MPRILAPRKVPLTPKQQRERLDKFRVTRTGAWIDPYPLIPGTKPEKMVYAELMRRRIPFKYQEWLHVDLAQLSSNSWYRPDFQLPDYKMIIEVQGSYWHTQAEQMAQDALKYSLYEMLGWKVLKWWDYEIEQRLHELFDAEPQLRQPAVTGDPYPMGKFIYDDAKGIKKANQKRRKPWTKKPASIKLKKRVKRYKKKVNNGRFSGR